MALPTLYTFRRCPYAIRARMALAYAGVDYEMREVDLKNKPQEMLQVSPKGTVPVLVLPNGKVLEESLDIMYWAARSHGDPCHWLPKEEAEQREVAHLIENNDNGFKTLLNHYKYPENAPNGTQQEHRSQAERFLAYWDRCLESCPFLLGERASIADVALFPFVRQFRKVDPLWFENSEYNRLKAWLKYHEDSELFLSVMHKCEPWKAGDKPLLRSELVSLDRGIAYGQV